MANDFRVRKGLIVNGSGSVLFDVQGSQGQLFSITDQLSGSLFAVSDASGIPVMEAFSDTTVKIGQYGAEAIIVSGSSTKHGAIITNTHQFTGSVNISGSTVITGSVSATNFTGSLLGTASLATTASNALTASYILNAVSASFASTASFVANAQTASYVLQAISSSFASTASFVNPLNQNVIITGSLTVSSSNATQLQVGSNLLFVSSSGQVGIGTTSPAYNLDTTNIRANGGSFIATNSGNLAVGTMSPNIGTWNKTVTLNAPSTNVAYELAIGDVFQSYFAADASNVYVAAYANKPLLFRTNNADVARFTTAGNLLIGTTTDAGYKLDVNGTARTTGNTFLGTSAGSVGINKTTANATLDVSGSAIISGSLTISGSSVTLTSTLTATTSSQAFLVVTGSLRQAQTASNQIYAVNITPTMVFTTGSQTNTVLRVAPTFSGSAALTSSQQNIIADFGATSVGSQFTVNDITSGSIYQVNDVSGLPIIEALSDWTVNMYNFPTTVFRKTGSAVIISGSLTVVTGSGIEFQVTNTGVRIGNAATDVHPVTGSLNISGSLNVDGTITATTLVVQTITSSQSWITGSTRFGNLLSNTHQFTGSVSITGSLTSPIITGSLFGTASWANNATTASNAQTASYILQAVSASFATTASYVTGSVYTSANPALSASYAATASFVTNAISASFASTASFVNPLVQNVLITGSLTVSSSNAAQLQVGSNLLFVSSSGAVGIGTTTPSSSYNLDVIGRSKFGNKDSTYSAVFYGNGSSINLHDPYGSGYNFVLSSDYSYDPFVQMSWGSGLDPLNPTRNNFLEVGSVYLSLKAPSVMSLYTGGTERLRIFNGGNIGIGTTTDAGYKFDVNGTSRFSNNMLVTGSVTATSFTGSLSGSATTATSASFATTASYVLQAVSASFASTASFVNTLNQNVLITGSLTVGQTTLGSNENTLVVGPSPAGGTGEGGQILLAAPGGTYTSASMWDNYQNYTRLLRGTNASSDAIVAQFNMHTKQVQFPQYNSSTAFTGTSVANLAVDANGNILTVATGTVTSASYAATASIATSASFASTASYVLNAVSASFATTVTSASYATTSSFAASGFTVGISQFQTATVASSIVGANNLFTTATGSFSGAKYFYTVTSGSNARMGEVFAIWNGGTAQFTDISTLDIGTTTAVTASVTIVTAQAQLNFQTNTSGWTIKTQATFI